MGLFPDVTSSSFLVKPDKSLLERWWMKIMLGFEITPDQIMVVGAELAREELQGRLYDSRLGAEIQRSVTERLASPSKNIGEPVWLSRVAANDTRDIVAKNRPKGEWRMRSITDPDEILDKGLMCVEGAILAESVAHCLYSQLEPRPKYTGSTSIMLLQAIDLQQKRPFFHAVLDYKFNLGGKLIERVSDVINGLEMSRADFDKSDCYVDKGVRIERIVGATKEFPLV